MISEFIGVLESAQLILQNLLFCCRFTALEELARSVSSTASTRCVECFWIRRPRSEADAIPSFSAEAFTSVSSAAALFGVPQDTFMTFTNVLKDGFIGASTRALGKLVSLQQTLVNICRNKAANLQEQLLVSIQLGPLPRRLASVVPREVVYSLSIRSDTVHATAHADNSCYFMRTVIRSPFIAGVLPIRSNMCDGSMEGDSQNTVLELIKAKLREMVRSRRVRAMAFIQPSIRAGPGGRQRAVHASCQPATRVLSSRRDILAGISKRAAAGGTCQLPAIWRKHSSCAPPKLGSRAGAGHHHMAKLQQPSCR